MALRSPELPLRAPDRPPARSGVALMLLASALFALMATCVVAAHQRDPELGPWVTSVWRAGVNLLALLALTRGSRAALWGDGRAALWTRGIAGAFSMLAYFGALGALSAGEASFLNHTSALWVAMLGPVLLGERTGRLSWLAVLGSLAGLALLVQPRAGAGDLAGRLLGLGSGLGAALAYVSVRRASETNPATAVVFWFTLLSSGAALAGALATGAHWPREAGVLALLVGSGLCATFAQLAMTRAYAASRAAPVAAAGAASPLFTSLLGAALLGQVPEVRAGVGMAILSIFGLLLPWLAERERGVQGV